MTRCPRCWRPLATDDDYDAAETVAHAHGQDSPQYATFRAMCWSRFGDCTGDEVTLDAAYRRGVEDGIRIARSRVAMDWSEVTPAVRWYAAGGGISRSGPYATQADAWAAMRYADDVRAKERCEHPRDTRVWPEVVR